MAYVKFKVGDRIEVNKTHEHGALIYRGERGVVKGHFDNDSRFVQVEFEKKGAWYWILTDYLELVPEPKPKLWGERLSFTWVEEYEDKPIMVGGKPNPTPTPNNIASPQHYTQGSIQPLDYIEANDLNFCEGNVIKYVTRARFKGTHLEDLKKAKFYIECEIKKVEQDG